jgi:hypothetical protein
MKTPCVFCKNHVMKPDLKLFQDSDLSHPEVLKANNEFESQKKARRILESNNIRDRPYLNYEPEFHGWCHAMSPFSANEHGEVLESLKQAKINSEEAKQKLNEIYIQLNILKDKAKNKDKQAIYTMYQKGAIEIGNQFSTGNIEYHYAVAENVNLNNGNEEIACPLFQVGDNEININL